MILNKNNYVAIIDYEMSNLFSVKAACDYVGIKSIVTNDINEILNAKAIILPGVGAFGEAMKKIKELKIDYALNKFIDSGKILLGICLGMQILYENSEEFGKSKGLGIIKGDIKKFHFYKEKKLKYPVPHVGWNHIKINKRNNKKNLLSDIQDNDFMYFVHSYYVSNDKNLISIATTNYGKTNFCSAIQYENISAVQFHPEKSGKKGLIVYENLKKAIEYD